MKHVPFNILHLELMDIRSLDRDSVLQLDNVKYALEYAPVVSQAITLVLDGRIMACMGYWSLFPGMAVVWLIPSIYVKLAPITFAREVERFMRAFAEQFKWTRIETLTRSDLFHRKWMKILKFKEEGVKKKYFNGQDFIMSARYFDWGSI